MSEIFFCVYCQQEAKYYCTCKDPNVYFCSEHRDNCEALPGDHSIKLINPLQMLLPNPIFRNKLAQRISKSKSKAENQKKMVIELGTRYIQLIKNEIKENLAKLDRYIFKVAMKF